jgi:hypothetical protein
MAVAVGFEPTEAFTSHAFEACSFGRSDTPPSKRLQDQPSPSGGEEPRQQRRTLRLPDAAGDLSAMVEPLVAHDVS